MKQCKPLPPLEDLRKAFAYDPDTGLFTHNRTSGSARKGDVAGSTGKDGYVRLTFCGYSLKAHRVAWLFSTGDDPLELQVDHKDREPSNNRISNLRLTTSGPNRANSISKGWFKNRHGQYQATIRIAGEHKGLGTYATPEEAAAAFQKKHAEIYGDFSPYSTQSN